ncbi:MAG: dethiobiotin synthase [Planctomycetaceae bacterium]
MQGLFITGTDTGVGKTHVTTAALRALRKQGIRVGGYKPVCSGARPISPEGMTYCWDDVEQIHAALGGEFPRELICPQTYFAPLAPPIAAAQEGREVDAIALRAGALAWRTGVVGSPPIELLLVEGAGGFLSPITRFETNADLAVDLQFPVVIVSPNRLGTINQTLLTIEAIRSRGLTVAGVVLNSLSPDDDGSREGNAREIQKFGGVNILGELPFAGGY